MRYIYSDIRMKQTAVEWLLEQLTMANFEEQQIAINKAKEMEKEQQEKLCSSEVIQRIRASKSDAEARRIIRTI